MEILVFDKEYDYEKNDYLDVLNNNLKEYNIILMQNLNDALASYKAKQYHIVLIDFTTTDGKEFLQEVNRLNSLQKIITMGYTLSCSSEMGCSYCVSNFHKRRLIKPINSVDLYKTISEFSEIKCKYENAFEKSSCLIKELVLRYSYFLYDDEKKIIHSLENDNQELRQLLNLMVDLKSYNIEFDVIDEKSIKIL